MKTEPKVKTLPNRIFAINYAGHYDFNETGYYGASLLNIEDCPNADDIVNEIARRYNAFHPVTQSIERFNKIIDNIESRCMAVDGPVTPTMNEATEDELSAIWYELNNIRKVLNPQKPILGKK